jgi:hypothetical protein
MQLRVIARFLSADSPTLWNGLIQGVFVGFGPAIKNWFTAVRGVLA